MMCTHLHCLYAYNISYIKIKVFKFEKFMENSFQIYLEIDFLTHTFRLKEQFKKTFFFLKKRDFVKKKSFGHSYAPNDFIWNQIKLHRMELILIPYESIWCKIVYVAFFLTKSIIFLQFTNVCKLIEKKSTKLQTKILYWASIDSWQMY